MLGTFTPGTNGGIAVTLNDELLSQLGDPGLEQIAGMLGASTATARTVIQAVSGTIIGGMARNVAEPEDAEALRGALDEHADADPFNGDVASLSRDGQGILAHVLGGPGTEQAAATLSRFSGVETASIMRLLPLIAPMVMSLLADRALSRRLDAGAVADELNQEDAALPSDLGGLLDGLLDDIFGAGAPRRTSTSPAARGQAGQGTLDPDW